MELTFQQIQCVSVPNVQTTQCNVYMYGIDSHGKVWFKRDIDAVWKQEPMTGLPRVTTLNRKKIGLENNEH